MVEGAVPSFLYLERRPGASVMPLGASMPALALG